MPLIKETLVPDKVPVAPNPEAAHSEGKLAWKRPDPKFYDIESVRASTTGNSDGSGSSAGSLS
jgi:hypothetical protein